MFRFLPMIHIHKHARARLRGYVQFDVRTHIQMKRRRPRVLLEDSYTWRPFLHLWLVFEVWGSKCLGADFSFPDGKEWNRYSRVYDQLDWKVTFANIPGGEILFSNGKRTRTRENKTMERLIGFSRVNPTLDLNDSRLWRQSDRNRAVTNRRRLRSSLSFPVNNECYGSSYLVLLKLAFERKWLKWCGPESSLDLALVVINRSLLNVIPFV